VRVRRLFTEILNAVHDCNDIKFTENGSWAPIQAKSTSSNKRSVDESSPLIHTVAGLYYLSNSARPLYEAVEPVVDISQRMDCPVRAPGP